MNREQYEDLRRRMDSKSGYMRNVITHYPEKIERVPSMMQEENMRKYEAIRKKHERPAWLKWYFLAFCSFELWYKLPHGTTEWIATIFALMVVNTICWWLFPYCEQLLYWFPTIAKLKAENTHLIAENKKLCEKVSHDGAYR